MDEIVEEQTSRKTAVASSSFVMICFAEKLPIQQETGRDHAERMKVAEKHAESSEGILDEIGKGGCELEERLKTMLVEQREEVLEQ